MARIIPKPGQLVLHHCHQARSMRSLWLLEELGLPYELVIHAFGKDLRSPDYLALHPLGRVPVLLDGATRLIESGAICQYLCEQYDTKGLGRPPGHPERPEWLQWLHYAETLAVHVATLTQQHIVIYEDKDRSPLVMMLETRRMEKALGVLDLALKARAYLLTSGFSAIDTAIGYSIYGAGFFTHLDAFPNLTRYFKRLTARPAWARALPPDGAAKIFARDFYPLPALS